MNNNTLSMETLNELRLMGAWKKMSEDFPWNEEQLNRTGGEYLGKSFI